MTEEELLALETDLKEDLAALARIRRLLAAKKIAGKKPDDRQFSLLVHPGSPPKNDDLEVEGDSLIGAIERIFNENKTARWTNPQLLARLQSTGYPLKAQKPIYSIGQAVNKLFERKKIQMIRKGVGSRPNVYQAADQSSTTEGVSADEQALAV